MSATRLDVDPILAVPCGLDRADRLPCTHDAQNRLRIRCANCGTIQTVFACLVHEALLRGGRTVCTDCGCDGDRYRMDVVAVL